MDISFERGNPEQPRGHALVYFRTRSEPDKIYATYIIALPISVDFAKYVPPFLANHLGHMSLSDVSAFSLPPVPEDAGSYQEIQRLADIRDDDLLYGGTMFSFDLAEMMQAVADIVRDYGEKWAGYVKPIISVDSRYEQDSPTVNEVMYGLMSGVDRLTELSKLIGSLRFAVEGNDHKTGADIEEDIKVLARHFPEHYYIPSLLQAVMDSSTKGAQLAQLYLERCYKLSHSNDVDAREIEEKIEALKATG